MKEKIRKSLQQYLGVYLIMIASFFLLLTITSLIPSSMLKNNIQESVSYLKTIGDREFIPLEYKREQLFIYTDEVMLNTAYSIDSTDPIYSFMTAKTCYIPGVTKIIYTDNGKEVPEGSQYATYAKSQQLELMINEKIDEAFEYARYWHGYLIFLRPLLIFFSYPTLRILSTICFLALTLWCIWLIMKKINFYTAIAFLIALLVTYIPIASSSLNEITCYYIAIITSIIILLRKNSSMPITIFFFIVGGVTSFLDFFTNPIVTLAIPFTIYWLLRQKKQKVSWKEELLLCLKVFVSWGVGYLLIWFSKWVLMDLLYGRNIIKIAIEQIVYRMIGGETENYQAYTILDILKRNFNFWGKHSYISVVCIGILVAVYGFFKNKIWKKKIELTEIIPYILLFILPIAWMIVCGNHSIWHAFFVYRIFCIMVFTFLIIIGKLFGIYGGNTNEKKTRKKC